MPLASRVQRRLNSHRVHARQPHQSGQVYEVGRPQALFQLNWMKAAVLAIQDEKIKTCAPRHFHQGRLGQPHESAQKRWCAFFTESLF